MKKKLYEKNAGYGLLIVLIFYAVLHLFTREKILDDRTFQELFTQYTAWDYLVMRYETWFSRVIIEAVFLLITRFPFIVWQISDTMMYVAIYWCFQQTFEIKGKANICLALSICCYIFLQMASAGWIITSITYTWTIATCFLCLIILKQYMQGQKLSIFHILMYILCTLYTCNYEIMAIAMLLIYLTLLIRQFIHRKKRLGLLYFGIALQALSILFIFTAPGNFLRVQQANSLYNQTGNCIYL